MWKIVCLSCRERHDSCHRILIYIIRCFGWSWFLSHTGQNYWMLIGWERGHFLRRDLVIKSTWVLDADWLGTPALSWFPVLNLLQTDFEKEFQKRIASEFDPRLLHLNVKENRHAAKCSLLVEKQKDFPSKKCKDSQSDKSLSVSYLQLLELF